MHAAVSHVDVRSFRGVPEVIQWLNGPCSDEPPAPSPVHDIPYNVPNIHSRIARVIVHELPMPVRGMPAAAATVERVKEQLCDARASKWVTIRRSTRTLAVKRTMASLRKEVIIVMNNELASVKVMNDEIASTARQWMAILKADNAPVEDADGVLRRVASVIVREAPHVDCYEGKEADEHENCDDEGGLEDAADDAVAEALAGSDDGEVRATAGDAAGCDDGGARAAETAADGNSEGMPASSTSDETIADSSRRTTPSAMYTFACVLVAIALSVQLHVMFHG